MSIVVKLPPELKNWIPRNLDRGCAAHDLIGSMINENFEPVIALGLVKASISALMNLPVSNGEGLQVLRYDIGGHSAPHFDFLQQSNATNQASIARSGQRVSTLVIYLNDVIVGGETIFPEIGVSISPQRGNGVYFEYANSQRQVDHLSLHAGTPVIQGEKWVVTKWMRERRFVSG